MSFTITLTIFIFFLHNNSKVVSFEEQAAVDSVFKSTRSLIVNGVNSPPRPFYATVRYMLSFCGATILNEHFLATAAHCVFFLDPDDLHVEIGDFNTIASHKTNYVVEQIFVAPGFALGQIEPRNDLALLKTVQPIANASQNSLPLCRQSLSPADMYTTLLAACGMGSTQPTSHNVFFPSQLQEMLFHQSNFESTSVFHPKVCRPDLICTSPLLQGGNICLMDDGGPLYKLQCGGMGAECLYGIASFTNANRHHSQYTVCNGGSYFANVVQFIDWIDYTIENNS